MRVVVVTPPDPVVTTDQAKDQLNVEHSDDDDLIARYVAASTAQLDGPDGWLGRAIGIQTLEARLDRFDCEPIILPYPPLIEVSSVKYLDVNGVEQVLDSAEYELIGSELVRAYGKSWPSIRNRREAVRILLQAGYSDTIDPRIHAAILLMTADLYANRETVGAGIITEVPMSMTVTNMLTPLRVWS